MTVIALTTPRKHVDSSPAVRRTSEHQRATPMYHRILVPLDGSATSTGGLREAIRLALSQGGEVRLVHVAEEPVMDCGYGPGTYGSELIESSRAEGDRILSDAQEWVRLAGLVAGALLLESEGKPIAAAIVAQASAWPADIVVMGTHGRRGIGRLALGSVAEAVARSSPVPVLLVRDIVHPTDAQAEVLEDILPVDLADTQGIREVSKA